MLSSKGRIHLVLPVLSDFQLETFQIEGLLSLYVENNYSFHVKIK